MKFDIRNAPLSKFNDTVLSVLDMHSPKHTWKTVGSLFLEKAFHKESIILKLLSPYMDISQSHLKQ